MTVTVKLLLIAALMLSIVIPFGTFLLGEKSKKRYKRTIGANAFFFFSSFVIAGIMMFSGTPVQAAETAAAVSECSWIRISGRSTFHRFVMCGRRYCRCKRGKRSAWRNQRGLQRPW